jgi:hypothetical protein
MSDNPRIAERRMTEEPIPQRPDDPEWRMAVGIRFAYVAAFAASSGVALISIKLATITGCVLLAVAASLHYRSWLRTLGKE